MPNNHAVTSDGAQVSLERSDDQAEAEAAISKLKARFAAEKTVAIEYATEKMKERIFDMETRVEESEELQMNQEQELESSLLEIETLKNDLENLEVQSSYLKVQGRLGGSNDSRETEALKKHKQGTKK